MGQPSAVPVLRQSSKQLCCNSPAKVSRDGPATVARLGFAKAAVTQGAQASWHLLRLPYSARARPQLLGRSAGVFAFHEFCLRPQGLGGAGGPKQLLLHPCLARANKQLWGGSSVLWLLLIFSAPARLLLGCFMAPLRLLHPILALSYAASWLEHGCARGGIRFSLASLILCLAPFPLSSWDCAHSPCTPASKKQCT